MLAIKSLVSPQRYFYALDLKRKRERERFLRVYLFVKLQVFDINRRDNCSKGTAPYIGFETEVF